MEIKIFKDSPNLQQVVTFPNFDLKQKRIKGNTLQKHLFEIQAFLNIIK